VGVETVTVMFTDLVDSTALLSRLGEERGEVVRREHFGLLRGAVEPCGGREVKNLGDGLMVVFPSAADAVSAAVGVQQAFVRRNRRSDGERLLVRIGIACGDADGEDGDYFGVPVVEAARLCGTAGGGEVLATELVRLLAGSRGGHAFTSLGGLELKGLDGPVVTHRIEWEAADDAEATTLPLPSRLAAARATMFVGRAAEYERLAAAWKAIEVEAGDGAGVGVMLLSGEPGIGKTTLSARFAADVHGQDAVVVYGRCDEDLGIPYQPWVETLGQLVAGLPDEVLEAHVAERGGSIARLIPGMAQRLGGVPQSGDGDAERFVLFACVTDLLSRAAQERAVLVVLDDLHWADQGTVQLLRHLATAGDPMRVGVLGTFRDSDLGPSHPLTDVLAALHRDGRVERISLQGFGDDELLALLERIAGHEMTDEGIALRDAVLAETSGNPFFTVEVLRHLAETGAIYQGDDGRWTSTVDVEAAGLPVSVKEVVGRRLAGLGAETERVLALAAVIGRDFDVPLLAAVADTDEDTLIELCDAAVSAAVLRTTEDPDRYSFAHALIAHTLHDGLSPARRARAHRAVADHLEALVGADPGDRVGELARHWMAATAPAEVDKAVHYAAAAGARALARLAPDEALRWYGEARDLLERHGSDDRQRAEVLLGLGTAQRQCGIAEHRDTLLDAARLADEIDAIDLLTRAALASSRGFMMSIIGEADGERLAVIERALERLGDTDAGLRAQLLALSVVERVYVDDLPDRLALAHEAVRTARRSDDSQALMRTLALATYGILGTPTLAQRVEWSDELWSLAEQSSDSTVRMLAAFARMTSALSEGDLPVFRSCATTIGVVIDRVPSADLRWRSQYLGVLPAILAGELEDAERMAGEAWVYGEETGQPDASTAFGVQLANIRDHQGRMHELIAQIDQTIIESPGLPAFRAALADACARGGDLRRAAQLLEVDRAGGLAMPEDSSWSTAHAEWARAAVLVGDVTTAQQVHDRLRAHHDQIVTTNLTVACALAHWLGILDHLLGRHDDAERWFEEAMAIHQGMESPLLVAYTDAAWAALLADRDRGDDRQRARAMAERALAVATDGGFGYIRADAQGVLARLP
jgi:class 3 adenylate cyclase